MERFRVTTRLSSIHLLLGGMDTYPANIDAQLVEFSKAHGLPINTRHRDEHVRSFQITDDQAKSYQLWIERSDHTWSVRSWDYSSRRSDRNVTAEGLREALDAAYAEILDWINESGHTRTPA